MRRVEGRSEVKRFSMATFADASTERDDIETEDTCHLTPTQAAIAFEEYGETEEMRRSGLSKLRSLILALPEEDRLNDLGDANLIRFLRCRKFDIDWALQTTVQLKKFYVENSEVLSDLNGTEFDIFFGAESTGIINFFRLYKNVCPKGRVIMVVRPSRFLSFLTSENLTKYPHCGLRLSIWLFDRLSRDIDIQVGGLYLFLSFSECTLYQTMSFSTMMTMEEQKMMYLHIQRCGIRLKGAYIFEEPTLLSFIWVLVKPFMSEKIQGRFFLCGSKYEVLDDILTDEDSRELLPEIFGGSVPIEIELSLTPGIELQAPLDSIWNP